MTNDANIDPGYDDAWTPPPTTYRGTPKLAAALAVAQGAFKPIPKSREVTVKPREGVPYKYKYSTMSDVNDGIQEALTANGLSISHAIRGRTLLSTLMHSSGEERVSDFDLSKVDSARIQVLGSALSYGQRYNVKLLLNLASDEDDDGQQAEDSDHKPGVPGSAGGGTDFRQRGPRRMQPGQSSANGRRMANDDEHLLADRDKGTNGKPPAPDERAQKIAARSKEFVDRALNTLRLTGHSVDSLKRYQAQNKVEIDFLEAKAPDQHERFFEAYNAALEAARARVS